MDAAPGRWRLCSLALRFGMSDQLEVGPPTRGALTCRELETRFVIRHEAFKAAQQFSRLLTVSAGGSITSRDFPSVPGVRQ